MGGTERPVLLGFSMRQTIFYPAPFATKVAQNTNHHFGRPIQNRRACLRPLPARGSCPPVPGLEDGKSPRCDKATLSGSAACQERNYAAKSHSRASLTPSAGAMGQRRAHFGMTSPGYMYVLRGSRPVSRPESNPALTVWVQQAFHRFSRGLCTSFQRAVPARS